MKIYLASHFDLVETVETVAEYLENCGHTIAVKWWSSDYFNINDKKTDHTSDAFYKDPLCQQIFYCDVKGVSESDALVLVGGSPPIQFTGADVEYGMAFTLGKPCFSIGALKHSAMYYPVIKCRALSELAEVLSGYKKGAMICLNCGSEMKHSRWFKGWGTILAKEEDFCESCGYYCGQTKCHPYEMKEKP